MPTIEELAADLAAVKASVPTLEEQLFSMLITGWNNGGDRLNSANAMTLLVAPIPLRILSAAISWEYWNLPADNGDYWEGLLRKGTGPTGWASIARRTTQNSGGDANGGVTADTAWTFDGAAWGDADLAAGELLNLVWAPHGVPADLDMPFTVTVRYRAL